jgi:hypothetical protein
MLDEAPSVQHMEFVRPAASLVDALRGTPTGFIVDALGGSGALDYRIKPAIADQAAFCGVALTCDAGPADNLALVAALQWVQPGDVIVAATGNYAGCAVTGDLVLGMARNCGAVGFVTDGCVRDLPGIRMVGLPCYCIGVTPIRRRAAVPAPWGFPSPSPAIRWRAATPSSPTRTAWWSSRRRGSPTWSRACLPFARRKGRWTRRCAPGCACRRSCARIDAGSDQRNQPARFRVGTG